MALLPAEIAALDAQDPIAPFRAGFALPPGVIYLDGNSLGALPLAAAERAEDTVRRQWGTNLIRAWNEDRWIDLPQRLGAKIARLIGADADQVIAADSTSVNLFKLVAAAAKLRPGRTRLVSELGNFPTDLYVMQGAAGHLAGNLTVDARPTDQVLAAIDETTALVVLTHVHYKTASMHDMAAITKAAHAAGALMLWDLSHSAGAVPVDLNGVDADFAIGCGYKYLNGGPGAPAFLYVARRWLAEASSPLSGWMGHANPFTFVDDYAAGDGINRFLCGTPSVLAMNVMDASLDVLLQAPADARAAKGRALGDLFIREVERYADQHDMQLASPRLGAQRGSHVSFTHPDGYPVMQALIEAGVIGDFRAPDILRFGFAPMYNSYADVWNAARILGEILDSGQWKEPRFSERAAVT